MTSSDRLSSLARAKINLTLHVGLPRSDGYHPLESMVVFADYGDYITAQKSDVLGLEVSGKFADQMADTPIEDNLILRAAKASGYPPAKFTLEKNLPVASGIGGGSANAAAALRLMSRLYGPIDNISEIALSLGADVPVCVRSIACIMSGIGDKHAPLPVKAPIPALLVNPGMSVSTAEIFKAFDEMVTPSKPPILKHKFRLGLVAKAKSGRNDLEGVTCSRLPAVGTVLDILRRMPGVKLARMSGSGATCFALFGSVAQADQAAVRVKALYPKWWVQSCHLA